MIGGGDEGAREGAGEAQTTAIDGRFVGNVSGTDTLVAVVAVPADRGQSRREVQVYVSDGERLSAWLSGQSVPRNTFVVTTDDRRSRRGSHGAAERRLRGGSPKLPDGKTLRYNAKPAAGTAGL